MKLRMKFLPLSIAAMMASTVAYAAVEGLVETTTGAAVPVDADIGTFALPASTTISAFGATIVDDSNAGAVRTTIGAATTAQGSLADSATQPGDIDTLSELNAIVGDATLIDTGDSRLSDSRDAVSLRAVGLDTTTGTPSDGEILVYRSAGTDWVLESKPAAGSNPACGDISDGTVAGCALVTAANVAAQRSALNVENAAAADQTAAEIEGLLDTELGNTGWKDPAIQTFVSAPATPTSTCTVGQQAWGSPYLYQCVALDTWVRDVPQRTW